jgi:hypothetical protein
MDSGASSHMTSDQGNLTQYFPSLVHNFSEIVVGNGSRLPILGTGHTHLRSPHINFILASVLHTPSLVSNLISVRKFTKDNWCSVEFDPFDFSVKDLISKTIILRSNISGELYPFAGSSKITNNYAFSTQVSSVDLLHRRLGHPSSASLSHFISRSQVSCNNKSSTPSVCEACQKGKHVCLPFSCSNAVTYFLFQLLHCDIWTSPYESVTGLKYYLIVIDDYSRYTWTFPLRFKSDVASTICDFYHYALNQFHLSIQCIQCDNGREFDNAELRSYLSVKGIVLCLSCPHTSAQNGKAEHGLRSINDIFHTLLFQANLKSSYWVEALHTVTYLFNHRPSQPLQLVMPYESLLPTTRLLTPAHIWMSLLSQSQCHYAQQTHSTVHTMYLHRLS